MTISARSGSRAAIRAAACLVLATSATVSVGCRSYGGYSGAGAPPASSERVLQAERRAPGEAESSPAAQLPDRMLVERAFLRLETKDLPGLRQRVDAMASSLGGFVQTTELDEKHSLRMQLRVPAASLEGALDTLRHLGKVKGEERSAEDVTEQVVDADARLRNLISVRDRLREHLARSGTVADVVAVERELARVQGEVDALEARLKHLRGTVALAELNLNASRPVVLGPLGWVAVGAGWVVGKLFVWRY